MEGFVMKQQRELAEHAWYKIGTEVNVGEPLFNLPWAKTLLHRALCDTKRRYEFEMRGLKLEGSWLTFYIKPADGYKLPKIMQWLKQTFSLWFNRRTGRKGHTWGVRYESEIIDGEPPPDAKEVDWAMVVADANKPVPYHMTYKLTWGSLRLPGMTLDTRVSRKNPPKPAAPPG
jgi:hypothetical protein